MNFRLLNRIEQRQAGLKNTGKAGFSMLEITIAVTVFAAAMLPLLMLSIKSTKQSFSLESHLVASQFAAGLMDRYLAMGFDECGKAIEKESFPKKLSEDRLFADSVSSGSDGFGDSLAKTILDFRYDVKKTEAVDNSEKDQVFTITISVEWPAEPGSSVYRKFLLKAVKFNENP